MSLIPLPIDAVLPQLIGHLQRSGAVVLRAPTGAGKTMRVPPAILAAGIHRPRKILMLEPRRVAAKAAAQRMAEEQGSPLGSVYGYQVRFERKAGPGTNVIVVTPGILLRMLQDDPALEEIGTIIFDEFHERGVESDLALGMVRLLRQTLRPDLNVVIMSATLDSSTISRAFSDCPIVASEGRSYPVDIEYRPRRPETGLTDAVLREIRNQAESTSGSILVFLPGMAEIRRVHDQLPEFGDADAFVLHGDLPLDQQSRVLRSSGRRKIVLATNVAESSVTVEGIDTVIDTGLVRQMSFDAGIGLDRLRTVPISRASADQRAGRAGRTGPGRCIRLWDEISHRARPAQAEPEIRRVDLAGPVLHLLAFGERDLAAFPWLDAPSVESLIRSLNLLERLGLVASGQLTNHGRIAARLPLPPRLACWLIAASESGCLERAALAAALLTERDPFERGDDRREILPTESDLLDRVEALEEYDRSGRVEFACGRLHRSGARTVRDVAAQFIRSIRQELTPSTSIPDRDEPFLRSLLAAFPERLCRRRAPNDRRGVMIGGRGVKLGPMSGVIEPELFLALDLDPSGADAFVRLASGIRREWLALERIAVRHHVEFDEASARLVARKRTTFDDLTLDDQPGHIDDEETAARVLCEAASRRLNDLLPDDESPAGQFLLRVQLLANQFPERNLPTLDTTHLRECLASLCHRARSLEDLRAGPWWDVLKSRFDFRQLQEIEREAPPRFTFPNGRSAVILYRRNDVPVLASRIQDFFGLTETPRIAGGRVALLLHLLAPNGRPQQVTNDLASFWKNGYPIVRKELRGRYVKHKWPENPLERSD